jgi:hypothetical protein
MVNKVLRRLARSYREHAAHDGKINGTKSAQPEVMVNDYSW